MILGLFKDDGNFNQNRIITSKKEECIKWGDNLFENFKNKINKWVNYTHLQYSSK